MTDERKRKLDVLADSTIAYIDVRGHDDTWVASVDVRDAEETQIDYFETHVCSHDCCLAEAISYASQDSVDGISAVIWATSPEPPSQDPLGIAE